MHYFLTRTYNERERADVAAGGNEAQHADGQEQEAHHDHDDRQRVHQLPVVEVVHGKRLVAWKSSAVRVF